MHGDHVNLEEIQIDWSLGPDTLYPASSLVASSTKEAVKLRVLSKMSAHTPVSVYTRMKRVVEQVPQKPALG